MRIPLILTAIFAAAAPAIAETVSEMAGKTPLHDPAIQHAPKDGVVKLYGAGGPHTAFQKVADAWVKTSDVKVEIIAGPEADWSKDAQADADIMWGTSEQSMTAYLLTYTAFSSGSVQPIYIRPAVIAVKAGNPDNITGIEDLMVDGRKIVVTEGAGIYNTSGTGVWEDVAGRLGRLDDIARFRKNIVAYGLGSGASYKQFTEQDADGWITWPNWPLTKDDLDLVEIEPDRRIWRDLSVALSPDADPEAQTFLDFLLSDEAQKLMATEGWSR